MAKARLTEIQKKRQAALQAKRPKGPEAFAEYREEPVRFSEEILGIRLWPKQQEILRSLTTHSQVAVRSGQKCGKTMLAVIAALWFVVCHVDAAVILTAPTGRQVREILWKELRQVYMRSRVPLGGKMNVSPAGGLRYPDGRQIIGFSVTDTAPEDMAGTSGKTLMYVIDEASGFSQAIFEAIEGNLGGSTKGRLLAISNPTQPSGFFFDAFHRSAAMWCRFALSSEEASQHADEFPGLMRPETIQRKAQDVGRDSPWFRIRILGEFPTSAINSVVSLADIDAAKERFLTETFKRLCLAKMASAEVDTTSRIDSISDKELCGLYGPKDGALELGVDVARFGDDATVIRPRRGRYLLPYRTIQGFDSQAVAGAVIAMAKELRRGDERVLVKVDGIGYGAGVVDALRRDEFRPYVEVIDVNVAKVSDDPERWPNLRSQLWFAIIEFFQSGGALHDAKGDEDGKLDAELLTPTYKVDPQGRHVVEPKADTKARLGRSPDRADATALAIYNARPMRIVAPPPVKQAPARWGDTRGF